MSKPKHVTSLLDVSSNDIREILDLAIKLKKDHREGKREPLLAGKTVALLFEKPSLRTRVSFEAGIGQLGGSSLFLGQDVGWGKREPVKDFSQVLSRYVEAIVFRSFSHNSILELAEFSTCPVINGLSDLYHPCQALADILTIEENLNGATPKVAFIGDANNVSRSLAIVCAKLGIQFSIAGPEGYQFEEEFAKKLEKEYEGFKFEQTSDAAAAVKDATAVYTDVWASMGQEAEQKKREKDFADFQVDSKLMNQANENVIFLHCLPARRGQEMTAEVIDGPNSRIVDQAENRMHAQKALLVWLLGDAPN